MEGSTMNDDDDRAEDAAALLRLLADWWEPPADLIATLPKGGVQLKYLGHSDTSRALTECDPFWTWEPMGFDSWGQPIMVNNEAGQPVGMWGWLTVCGVRRPAYGSVMPGKGDAVKELIGDLIRNGAMRFGVAGALWSKADRTGSTEKPSKGRPKKPEAYDPAAGGKANYDGLVKMYGEQQVKDALVKFKITQFSDLVGDTIDKVDDHLHAMKLMKDDLGALPEPNADK